MNDFKEKFKDLLENYELARELKNGETTLVDVVDELSLRFSTSFSKKDISKVKEVVDIVAKLNYNEEEEYYFKKDFYENFRKINTRLEAKYVIGGSLCFGAATACSFLGPAIFLVPSFMGFGMLSFSSGLEKRNGIRKKALKNSLGKLMGEASIIDEKVQEEFIVDFYIRNPKFFKKVFILSDCSQKKKYIKKIKESGVKNKEVNEWLKETYENYYHLLTKI